MPHKNLGDISNKEWIFITIIAVWAIIGHFLSRTFKSDTKWQVKLYFLLQDFVVSGGITYLVALLCMGYGLPDLVALSLAGFSGYKAAEFTHLLEKAVRAKLGLKDDNDSKRV